MYILCFQPFYELFNRSDGTLLQDSAITPEALLNFSKALVCVVL